MSCYFRHMKDVFTEAGVSVTPANKQRLDQAIHAAVGVRYKQCMPDCWSKVKIALGHPAMRAALVRALKQAHRYP